MKQRREVFCSGRKFYERREYCDKRHLRLQQKRYSTSDRRKVTGVARLKDSLLLHGLRVLGT